MSTIWTIAAKDIREILRNRATYIYVVVLLFISFPYFSALNEGMSQLAKEGADHAALQEAGVSFLTAAMYSLPLTLSMLFCSYLSAYAIILDKAKRTLESLLATPASLRQVWLGKSLAVALPSIAVTFIVIGLLIPVLNYAAIVPKVGHFVWPGIVPLVSSIVAIPVLAFMVVAAVSVLQLTMANPRLANGIFIVVFFAFYLLTMTGVSRSWNFALVYLAIFGALAIANLVVTPMLTRERVVLSSKGQT